MADFTALKASIQAYIKQNGNEQITGNILQDILIAMVQTMGDGAINSLVASLNTEVTNRQNADGTLQNNINAEATARQGADTTLQNNINAEATARTNADTLLGNAITAITTQLGEGSLYAGLATTTTNPGTPTGKVFYIATAAGTYTNFLGANSAAIVLTQGINILKYNGTAWASDQVVGIDEVLTAGSNNLAKSGVVQNELALGAVYDVSAKNPTGGPNNDGKWESLSVLLSDDNLNTLIPAAYRKGGMSIKFVCTYDNKYVQARCMAQNFTTDVTQWQGVDEMPTANSKNLVESGGVYKTFIELSDSIKGRTESYTFESDHQWGEPFFPVPAGTIVKNIGSIRLRLYDVKNGLNSTLIDVDDVVTLQHSVSIMRSVESSGIGSIKTYGSIADKKPTANSYNLVESGGVYDEFALGGVYDVSAKNPTAGSNNDGKWESLSALLSDANLDTLIPAAARKGGMSIKFIQSSNNNNKYVQYRYMEVDATTSATFTNVANWQGVDDEPAAGSENLVKSGGVYKIITENISISNSYNASDFTDGYYNVSEGVGGTAPTEPTVHSTRACLRLEVKAGQTINLKTIGGQANARAYALTDINRIILSVAPESDYSSGITLSVEAL